MKRRQDIQDVVEAALLGAGASGTWPTSAKDKVYVGRSRPIEPDRSTDAPPMLCVYFPDMQYQSQGSPGQRYTEILEFQVECWAAVDPGRARSPSVVDKLQEQATNKITAEAFAAIWNTQAFQALFTEKVDVKIQFGIDIMTQNRVGASVISFKSMQKGMPIPIECPTYDDLRAITVEHDVRGSIGGSEPSDAGFEKNPDMVQQFNNLDIP